VSKPKVPRPQRGEDGPGEPVVSLDDARRRRQLDALFREHGPFLRRLAARLCRKNFDPDDLVQDVLARTLQHFDRLPPGVDHRAWMTRVMRNLFIDQVRRRAASPVSASLDIEPVAPPPELREWWERLDADDIRAQLQEVPEELRRAFDLFALEGCSYETIATRLGVPKATVGTRILRARRKLKQLFMKASGHDDGEG
jgi:RNA polymerase sigma-70 factor (ECF subfamily)